MSSAERARRQRERLLAAGAEALAAAEAGRVTVSAIVARAQVGRNTFYEHFATIDEAVDAVARDCADRILAPVERAAREASTPTERLRAIVRAWLHAVASQAGAARVLLRAPTRVGAESFRLRLAAVLREAVGEAYAHRVVALPAEEVRVAAAAGAAEAVAERCVGGPHAGLAETSNVLVDVILRAFR